MRFTYIALLFTVFSCSTADREKSDELNKKGTDYYFKAVSILEYSDHDDKKVFADSCLYFMSEAIKADSSNKSAYWNKMGFEFGLNALEKAKATAWLYCKKFDEAEGLFRLGAIYHKLNDSINSKKYFKQALDFYESGIKSGKLIEDSILMNLATVNLANKKIDEARDYYERYRATYRGQIFKDVEFDSVRQMFMNEGNDR